MKINLWRIIVWISFILVVISVIVLAKVSALSWSNNTFNNSLTNENLKFTGNENITRWLAVPDSVSALINGFLNLSGYSTFSNLSDYKVYYRFDELIGGNLTDEVIPQNNLTIITPGVSAGVEGVVSGAFNFSGVGENVIEATNFSKFNSTDFTISMWLNWTESETGAQNFPFGLYDTAGQEGFYVDFNDNSNDDEIAVTMKSGGGTKWQIKTTGDFLDSYPRNQWVHFMVVYKLGENGTLWINGTIPPQIFSGADTNFTLKNLSDTGDLDTLTFGAWHNAPSPAYSFIGRIDEFGYWKMSLSGSEIINLYDLYNSNIRPSNPENISLKIGNIDVFNYTGEFNQTNNKTSNLASTINKYLNATYLVGANYLIPFIFHSDTMGILRYLDLIFNNEGMTENSQSYNTPTYETSSETFNINITYDSLEYTSSSATLYYDGTSYSGTKTGSGNNIVFSKTLDIPTIASQTNKTFNWQIALTNSSGTNYFNTSSVNQTVSNISLSICGGDGGNTPYINFTFKDEESSNYINASTDLATWTYYLGGGSVTKTYIFTNTSENPSYAYCFDPPDKTLSYSVTYQYSGGSYPQRYYTKSGTLTNSTTNTVLYLLGSSDGIYSSFQIVTTNGNPISGATVQVERQFSGVWTLVGEGTTDSSGLATFWLNPNYDHKATVTKSGYVGTTETIRPTQSIYTIVLSGGTGNETYFSGLEGIYFTRSPLSGILSPGTYDFTFNVTADNGDMVNCKFELTNSSGYTLDSTSTACTSNAFLSITYTLNAGDNIYGKYYVDMGDGYILLEGDGNWKSLDANITRKYTLRNFFERLSDPTIWADNAEEEIKYEYTKFVAFFLIMAIILGFANYKTGFDNANPGITLFGLPFLIFFVSLAGTYNSVVYSGPSMIFAGRGFFYITNATAWTFFNNYVIAFYSLFIALGFYLATIRREG